jgi:hypothetical protein
MTVVGALAGLALVGCSSNGRSGQQASDQQQSLNETRENAQQDLAQARQEGSQDVNQAQQNLEKTKQEAQQNVNETARAGQQDIQQQRQDINQDRQEQQQESATGGSGAAMASQSGSVTGTLSDMDEKSLTIKDSAGNEVALQRNASTTVTQNGKSITADQLQKGSEVRASYKVDENGDKQAQSISLEAAPSENTMNPDQHK